ncbi:hypothetical protein [Aequorivita lipolytica]|uniref:Uncharacterized protein n=1 Tax=Aequorivita lipolytica TaxID=153267 RepID=A0A5C6YRQ1_9FLAO|nr:hypothetical protein [Aequorivita lipolytica]TXD70150.1 hypothetical protein ESV24_02980 [Aequorivita lipolytica]SRX50566.1 hypothetical protein AEQU2_01039 [Aequorivita lipolytica]
MKKKLREQITALGKQLIEEEKTFKSASVKGLVAELYEKLTVLEYLENQLGDDSEAPAAASLDSKSFREENWFTEPEPVPQPDHKEDLIEPLMEKIKDIVAQMPQESERIDELLDEMLPKNPESETAEIQKKPTVKYVKNDLEEFASNYQQMPEFERKNLELFPKSVEGTEASKTMTESRARSINDSVNKGLNIGLNDRLAFIKHLFEGQVEDYTRVLSQINTMQNFEEAQSFIKGKVKPDYNYWLNKEEYSERFMNIIEKRFN